MIYDEEWGTGDGVSTCSDDIDTHGDDISICSDNVCSHSDNCFIHGEDVTSHDEDISTFLTFFAKNDDISPNSDGDLKYSNVFFL